jgi:hypothetical protein
LGAFSEQEIEDFAWDEEATATSSAAFTTTDEPQTGYTSNFARSSATTESDLKPPSSPTRAGSVEVEADFAEEAGAQTKYQEQWPQTASYSPSSSFRSYNTPKEEPRESQSYAAGTRSSRGDYAEEIRTKEQRQGGETPSPLKREETKEMPRKMKKREEEEEAVSREAAKTKAKKAAPPPGTPVLPGKKGEALSFAAHMEEEEAKKETVNPPIPAKVPISKEKKAALPPGSLPNEVKAEEEKATLKALPGIPTAIPSFPSLKQAAPTTISEKKEKEEAEGEEGIMRPSPLAAAISGQGADQGEEQGKKKREGQKEGH